MFSTLGGYHDACGWILCVHQGMFSSLGDTMSTSGVYHEYIRGCSVHWGDIMMHVGEQVDRSLSSSIENPDVLNISQCAHDIPRCTHDIPPNVLMVSPACIMVSSTCINPPYVLNIPRCTNDFPWCTHDMPPTYLTTPDVLIISPRCTNMVSPDVLNTSQCTEHPSMYWTYIIRGDIAIFKITVCRQLLCFR